MNCSFLRYSLIYIGIVLILSSCASTGRPSGGPKDTDAPVFVVEKSSPNYSTNYSPEKIELVFDEWIELKNQNKEILISPPFFKNPKITQRGKKVTVEFPPEEPLRPDATYTLNFGESIVDFTEANPVKGFRFLFATGDKIDSLSFDGKIVDAYGGDPIEDVLIMLYDVLGDSVVVSEKPFYYTRADEDGGFKFENLKNDTFKLMVIEDLNFNYLLDDEVERLAFIDSTFILNDSSKISPELRLFQPEQSTRILDSNSKKPGLITTVFNKNADEIDPEILYPINFKYSVETKEDTMKFWFAEPYDSVGIIYGLDTLDFMIKPFDTTFYKQKISISKNNLLNSNLAPFDSLVLSFNAPLLSIDTSLIRLSDRPKILAVDSISLGSDSLIVEEIMKDSLTENIKIDSLQQKIAGQDSMTTLPSILDSLKTREPSKDSINMDGLVSDSLGLSNPLLDSLLTEVADTMEFYDYESEISLRDFVVKNNWIQGHEYQLLILPGGVTDIYGRTCDTIIFDFKTNSIDEYGNINLTATGLDSTEQYIVILRDGDKKIKETKIADKKQEVVSFNRLPVSTYNIHLIKDENRDGKWTTGDYWKGRQPELMKKFELEKLRENWDLEATISWDGVVVDTLGVGVDSSFIQLDSLGQSIKPEVGKDSKNPDKKGSSESNDKKRGIRGRRG